MNTLAATARPSLGHPRGRSRPRR